DDARSARVELAQQAEVLLVAGHDLVALAETEPGNDDLAAPSRGVGERDEFRRGSQDGGETRTSTLSLLEDPLDVCSATAALDQVELEACFDCLDVGPRQGSDRAGVEIRVALEDGELRACLVERHSTTASTGA